MVFHNTSHYPAKEVRKLVEIATKGVNTTKVAIHIRNSQYSYYGRAYFGVPSISRARGKAKWLMVVRIGAAHHFPLKTKYPRLKTAPEFEMKSWKEAMVAVVAHEARHIQQFQRGWRRSEIDAERYAVKRLEVYRGLA